MRIRVFLVVCGLVMAASCEMAAQSASSLAPDVRQYVKVDAPVIALTHVRVIDGTGAPARADQTIVISEGKIQAVGDATTVSVPPNAKVLNAQGETVIPGLVMMHEHLFYAAGLARNLDGSVAQPIMIKEAGFSFPRLYLAAGVTFLRTAGSLEPYADLNIKQLIDAGKMPGPKIDVTGPYLEGPNSFFAQMHQLTGPDDARKLVNYWADQGVTSFKAYMNITHAELSAAIQEAHKRKIKVTGHLCSVTQTEAAELSIDDLEHGPMFVDTEFVPGKQADQCPSGKATFDSLLKQDVDGAAVQKMMHTLIDHHVAVTSTLPVFELDVPGRPPLRKEVLDSMLPQAEINYLQARASRPSAEIATLFQKELQFEHEFAKAGGLLLAGCDPTGIGGVLAGFGDQREIELLVEAGFTPVEAIHIATANGAEYEGQLQRIGTIAKGKQADLVLINGDPSARISDIEKVDTVFKDGVGYDSQKLSESVRGTVGLF
ncbi:MAG TPA: amidohydrolase family protein [Terriglobales bacterium]|nr:amidohydrolase family protein [Terriglobales bacterium]